MDDLTMRRQKYDTIATHNAVMAFFEANTGIPTPRVDSIAAWDELEEQAGRILTP